MDATFVFELFLEFFLFLARLPTIIYRHFALRKPKRLLGQDIRETEEIFIAVCEYLPVNRRRTTTMKIRQEKNPKGFQDVVISSPMVSRDDLDGFMILKDALQPYSLDKKLHLAPKNGTIDIGHWYKFIISVGWNSVTEQVLQKLQQWDFNVTVPDWRKNHLDGLRVSYGGKVHDFKPTTQHSLALLVMTPHPNYIKNANLWAVFGNTADSTRKACSYFKNEFGALASKIKKPDQSLVVILSCDSNSHGLLLQWPDQKNGAVHLNPIIAFRH